MVTACRRCCQFFAMAGSPHYFFSFLLYLSDISELYCSDPSSILAGEISFTSRVGGKCCRNFGVVNWLEFFGGWGGSAAEILVGGIVSTY